MGRVCLRGMGGEGIRARGVVIHAVSCVTEVRCRFGLRLLLRCSGYMNALCMSC